MATAPFKAGRMLPSSALSLGMAKKVRWTGHGQVGKPSLRARLPQTIKEFLRLRGTPGEIAFGFAAGILVGMSPFMMCHSAMAICLASLLKGNRLSAVAAVFITNPISAPMVYGWTYRIGKACLEIESARTLKIEFSLDGLLSLFRCAPEILWILTVGGFVAGLPLAVLIIFFVIKPSADTGTEADPPPEHSPEKGESFQRGNPLRLRPGSPHPPDYNQ